MSKSIKSLKPYNQTKTSFSELKPFDIPEEEKFSLKKYYEEQRRKWEEEQLRKQAEPLQSAPLPVNYASAAAASAAFNRRRIAYRAITIRHAMQTFSPI